MRSSLSSPAPGLGIRQGLNIARQFAHGMDLVAIEEVLGHSWVVTTMNYIHVQRTHVEDAWISGLQRASGKLNGLLS